MKGLGMTIIGAGMLTATLKAGERFTLADVFELEYASDPQLSPSGREVTYVRNFMDRMNDRARASLWRVSVDGSDHRPVTAGDGNESFPRYSPDGTRLLYLSSTPGEQERGTQVYLRWRDSGETARLSSLAFSPRHLTWSPDGQWIAFTMFVPETSEPMVKLPPKPKGAQWAEPARVIEKLIYRSDGRGFLPDGNTHLFVLPAEGGSARQVTKGSYDVKGPLAWLPDGKSILFTSNRRADWEYDPKNQDIYCLSLADGQVVPLTDRKGPDHSPVISPDGAAVVYVGYDDREQGYQLSHLYLMNTDGSGKRLMTTGFGRSVRDPAWSEDGSSLLFRFDDGGKTFIGSLPVKEGHHEVTRLVEDVGGTTLGRPYASGGFSQPRGELVAYTAGRATRPADVAVVNGKTLESRRLTDLNRDALGHKELGAVSRFLCKSAHDGKLVEGWLITPPGFRKDRKYPLILEIHGGPFLNYGPRFAAELQLFAAAGYVVVYANPRGSTSYGEDFGNAIHHAYPGHDYEDLMAAVDEVIKMGFIDEKRLFVTGGSGGGTLTAWIVGRTKRFAAAVSAKPVINWTSFALTADHYNFFYRYWFPGAPWEEANHYWNRSPLSLVGAVETPTMLLTGEVDYRTPMSESEQYYQALKIRKVDTALVRLPETSHGIASRPTRLMSKVAHILAWFARHGGEPVDQEED